MDAALRSFGATRGSPGTPDIKSTCRLLCPVARRHEFVGWDTEYIRSTTQVLDSDAATTALGAPFGPSTHLDSVVSSCIDQVATLREAIVGIDHTPTEFVLTRQCANVSKLVYHMRINGDRIDHSATNRFDRNLRAAIEVSLGGDLPDTSWLQATTGVTYGGLGLRSADSTALPAFVASRVSSRPLVRTMVDHYATAIGASADVIMRAYDRRTEDAIISLVGSMPTDIGINLLDDLANLGDEASTHWQAILDGNDEPIDAVGRAVDGRGYPRAAITPADGEDDPEHPDSKSLGRTLRIQSYITAVVDADIRDDLRQQFETMENHTSVRRIDELSDINVCHTWLWHLNKHHGPALTPEEYLEAVRVRLGCAGPTDLVPCSRCGQALFDSSGAHAPCCAVPESTCGHYGVR